MIIGKSSGLGWQWLPFLTMLAIWLGQSFDGFKIGAGAYYLGAILVGASIIVSLRGNGLRTGVVFVVFAVVYPIMAPYVSVDFLGFHFFSGRAPFLQIRSITSEPLIVAGLSALYVALCLKSARFDLLTASLNSGHAGPDWTGHARDYGAFILTSALAVLFAWLTEPGGFVLAVSYTEIIDARFQGTAFAGGAWAVMAVASLYFYLRLGGPQGRAGRRADWIFWVVVFFSYVWFLGHARRSEISGYTLMLILVYAPRIRILKVVGILAVIYILLAVVEVARRDVGSVNLDSYVDTNYHSLPGGVGNVAIGYIAAYWLTVHDRLSLAPGETYYGHLVSLPPSFLGIDRPPNTYDYIDKKIPLTGGEYFLNEPLINFGIIGIAFYTVIFTWLLSRSLRTILRSAWQAVDPSAFFYSGVFLVLLFRTLWYGSYSLIKGAIIAFLVLRTLSLLGVLGGSSSSSR